MSATLGASAGGARAMTATAANGLALMWEIVYIAASNRLPIVSFDCKNGPRELIVDGENGYLVDCFDLEAMAERIGELMADREKRIRFSEQAQSQFAKLDPDRIVARWQDLFRSL